MSSSSSSSSSRFAIARLRKELERFSREAASAVGDGDSYFRLLSPDNYSPTTTRDEELTHWQVILMGPKSSLYKDETFLLDIQFPPAYPIDPPMVRFCVQNGWSAPVHEHVYSNGIICMSLLTKATKRGDWSPVMTTSGLLLSLLSMLSSAQVKRRPEGHDLFVRMYGPSAERWDENTSNWDFHDNTC